MVYFETFGDIQEAIAREKQIKGWPRARKVELIKSVHPEWKDLAADWMKAATSARGVILRRTDKVRQRTSTSGVEELLVVEAAKRQWVRCFASLSMTIARLGGEWLRVPRRRTGER